MVLFSSTLGNILWLCLIANIAFPYVLGYWRKRKRAAGAAAE
jgi:hypothetical protein